MRRSMGIGFVWGALVVATASSAMAEVAVGAAPRWQHIKTALFFTNQDVQTLLATPEQRRATLSYFAPLRLGKVYLEGSHHERHAVGTLGEIVAALRATGIEVSGAVVPVGRHGPFCYNNADDMATLEARVRELAEVVDEIIVDDWLFTTCTCAKCLVGRGSESWADYRSRLVAEQSKLHLIDAAKRVRPNVRVIIKYPNWYEGHRQHGYDVARQTPQFDAVSVGIETRQRATHDQHIPIYSGYVFQRWIGGDAGPKWASAWLDNYRMQGAANDYVAQVWQAVLARAPEIIFWCAGQLVKDNPSSDVYPHLAELMPEFDRLAGMLAGAPRGIPIHLPLGSVGEYNVFGHLGMSGMPLAPVTAFPSDGAMPIFTRHSLAEPGLATKLFERVQSGREVFLTWQLLRELRQSEMGRVFNVIAEQGTVSSATFRTQEAVWDFKTVDAPRAFAFPRIELSTWPYVRDVALVREDADFGVLLRAPYLDGQVHVLNPPDNSYDLQRLPEAVLNVIRRPFAKDLGVRLMGPGGVALYLFGERQYVLYNMNDRLVSVALRLPLGTPMRNWAERMHDARLDVREVGPARPEHAPPIEVGAAADVEVGLTLPPFEIALIERP